MASTIFTQNIVWNLTLLCNRLTFTQLIRLDSSLFLIIIHLKNLKKKKFHWKMMCLYSLINYVFFLFFFRCVYCIQVWCVCVWNSPIKKKKYWERESEAACVCVWISSGAFDCQCVCVSGTRRRRCELRQKGKKEEREREREGKENAINT